MAFCDVALRYPTMSERYRCLKKCWRSVGRWPLFWLPVDVANSWKNAINALFGKKESWLTVCVDLL
jgi:hypothetical protein